MKRISLMILLTIFTACEPDDASPAYQPRAALPHNQMARADVYPENQANPYDIAGQLHNTITEAYLNSMPVTTTTANTIADVEAIANANPSFLSVKPGSYVSPTAARIDYIAANEVTAASQIISNAALSQKAKLSLSDFIDMLMDYREANMPYETIYQYIIAYETSVANDTLLTIGDKRIMLTTSSISRYAFYLRKKRPRDRDWDISWGNIVAGIEGVGEDMAKAIVMSAVTGIVHNK
jgi:hypothetical protein